MSRLVDDLLAYARHGRAAARARAGRRSPTWSPRPPTSSASPAETRGARARVGRRAEPGLWVDGDRVALRQALANLLANAVRLAPEGIDGPGRRPDATARGSWMAVEDEGPGIAAERPATLVFQRFWRGDQRRRPRRGPQRPRAHHRPPDRRGPRRARSGWPPSRAGGSTFSLWLPARSPARPHGPLTLGLSSLASVASGRRSVRPSPLPRHRPTEHPRRTAPMDPPGPTAVDPAQRRPPRRRAPGARLLAAPTPPAAPAARPLRRRRPRPRARRPGAAAPWRSPRPSPSLAPASARGFGVGRARADDDADRPRSRRPRSSDDRRRRPPPMPPDRRRRRRARRRRGRRASPPPSCRSRPGRASAPASSTTPSGLILTAAHVVDGADAGDRPPGRRHRRATATVVGTDAAHRRRRRARSTPADGPAGGRAGHRRATSEVGQTGRRHRQPVRPRPDRHLRHRQRRRPDRADRRAAPSPMHPDRRADQPGQLRRRAGRPPGPGHRHQRLDRQREPAATSASASPSRSTPPRRVADALVAGRAGRVRLPRRRARPTRPTATTPGALIVERQPGQPGRRRRPRSAATSSPRSTATPIAAPVDLGRRSSAPHQPGDDGRRSPSSATARRQDVEVTLGSAAT